MFPFWLLLALPIGKLPCFLIDHNDYEYVENNTNTFKTAEIRLTWPLALHIQISTFEINLSVELN